jgi:YhcH/YjgK/YiaL family protein
MNNMKKIILLSVIQLLLSACTNVSAQPIPTALTGQGLKSHETINKTEFAKQYQMNKNFWDKAFAFLTNRDLKTLAVGRHAIDSNNVFAFITENPTKDPDSTKWESHRNYIDLHLVITGEEKIGVADISTLMVTMPYDESKDLINYTGEGKFYTADPGTFFLFFPSDAHRPGVTTGGNKPDKKIVIKIRYSE